MNQEFYISVTGATQGKFKGEGVAKPYQDKIVAWEFEHSVQVPRDVKSGAATGRRQHTVVAFTKKWGPTTPQFAQAMIKNEVLPSVLFEFIHRRPDGGEETVYFTIKLTNAFVSNISRFTAKEKELPPELERVALTYGKIEWEHKEAKTMAADTWTDHAGN